MKTTRLVVALSSAIFLAGGAGGFAQSHSLSATNLVFQLTNSAGQVITDAVPVQILANKVIYTSSAGGGSVPLASLPVALQQRFAYNPAAATAADESERLKRQQQFQQQQQQLKTYYEQLSWGVQGQTVHPFQYQWRLLGGTGNVDLQLLFNWWGYAAHMIQPVWSTNSAAPASYIVPAGLSAKPIKGWDRLTAANFTMYPSYWILDATVQSAPYTNWHAKIYLLNPPNGEQQAFETARRKLIEIGARIQDLTALQNSNRDAMASVNRRVEDITLYRYYSFSLSNRLNGAAMELSNQWAQLSMVQQDADARKQSLEAQAEDLQALLNRFPSQNAYVVDLFAFDTGRTIYGMEVYDLGYISFQ